jgi:hypothetical protein
MLPDKSLCSFVTFLLPKQLERASRTTMNLYHLSLLSLIVVTSGLHIDHDIRGFVLIRLNHHQSSIEGTSAGFGRW